MTQEPPILRALFHYNYTQDGVILDQQYNYQSNLLAIATSNGEILFYSAESDQQNRQPLFTNDRIKNTQKKNAAILKIAWSLPVFDLFASASISQQIDLYACSKGSLTHQACKVMTYIPLSLAFCPIETEAILAVGLSDGSVCLLNQELKELTTVRTHNQAINCLAWDHRILTFQKNKWITESFKHLKNSGDLDQFPLLITGSSDSFIKAWRFQQKKLILLSQTKAHDKQVRDVQWRPAYQMNATKCVISCSEDGVVRIWQVKYQKKFKLVLKETRHFSGPVYKANFNYLGNMIAVSYCNDPQQRVQTVILRQKNGLLMGQEIKI